MKSYSTGSRSFVLAVLRMIQDSKDQSSPPPAYEISDIGQDALDKLDGVWSVQLFFRTWPYYANRATNRDSDPDKDYDVVLSENLPIPQLPPDASERLDVYTKQLWAMSIVYIEAILEHYFLGQLGKLFPQNGKHPRQASLLFERLQNLCAKRFGITLSISNKNILQLYELTETRHLWVHGKGIVDDTYLKRTKKWWQSRPTDWHEPKPIMGNERKLSELYIKSNIYFSKSLIAQIDSDLIKIKGHT